MGGGLVQPPDLGRMIPVYTIPGKSLSNPGLSNFLAAHGHVPRRLHQRATGSPGTTLLHLACRHFPPPTAPVMWALLLHPTAAGTWVLPIAALHVQTHTHRCPRPTFSSLGLGSSLALHCAMPKPHTANFPSTTGCATLLYPIPWGKAGSRS